MSISRAEKKRAQPRMAHAKTVMRLFIGLFLLLVPAHQALAETKVTDLRLGITDERTRLVLELSGRVSFDIMTLDNPRRIVIDMPSVSWPSAGKPASGGLVAGLRYGQFTADKSRLVIDAAGPVKVANSFLLNPASGFPHRLVVDLVKTDKKSFAAQVRAERQAKLSTRRAAPPAAPIPEARPRRANVKPVIVIDAGHGGVDPGASGRRAREKDVTLTFARELARQLRAEKNYTVYLTRNRDIYIPLRQRVSIARKHNADLFISIHADAIKRRNVRGMSIYTLSETASDKEAAALARKENQSDIIAGIDFNDQPREVADILIDLAQRETKNLSVKFANLVVNKARGKTRLLERTHRFAGFRVLKAPDVPSVLIELGFLTNRNDENQLVSASWRRKMAGALVDSIDSFFSGGKLASTGP